MIKLPKGWRLTRFDEFLTRVDRKVTVDDSLQYKCVGVRWYGMGTFVREEVPGMNISRKQQWIIRASDIVYNKLFAWKGAFAIAGASVDGCIVSDKFPTYVANQELIDPRFLSYYFRTPQLADQAKALSKGAAAISKLTLNPPQFWELTILLPPLEEQRRLVVRIEELANKIQEARTVRDQSSKETEALLSAEISALFTKYHGDNVQELGNIIEIANGQGLKQIERDNNGGHPVYGAGGPVGNHNATLSDKPFVVIGRKGSAGHATYAANGGWVIDTAYYAFPQDNEELDCKYLYYALKSLDFKKDIISTAIPGINRNAIYRHKIPIPLLPIQRHIASYLDGLATKVDELKHLQAETTAELDALLPSILDKAFKGEL